METRRKRKIRRKKQNARSWNNQSILAKAEQSWPALFASHEKAKRGN